jgi:hypothetical protein
MTPMHRLRPVLGPTIAICLAAWIAAVIFSNAGAR